MERNMNLLHDPDFDYEQAFGRKLESPSQSNSEYRRLPDDFDLFAPRQSDRLLTDDASPEILRAWEKANIEDAITVLDFATIAALSGSSEG